ncbi:unnamed protein product [Cochlearia groenlandica]
MGKHQVWFLTACVFLFLSLTSHAISLRGVGSSSVNGQTSKDKDFIKRQSGQPEVSFKQYGGYVAVDTNRFLYYYFAEVANANNSAPLVLWMNGGPGCSSLQGAYLENGPFRIHSDGKTLYNNPYSWNKEANVLYIEAPAQVGFSYTTDATGWYEQLFENGDKLTAEDNYNFLVNWLERFPEYKGREFYITGQSYAGHYGPQLSQLILNRNNKTFINLKGVMLGNPGLNRTVEEDMGNQYLIDHALISQSSMDRVDRVCDRKNPNSAHNECTNAFKSLRNLTNRMDLHNIYAPVCLNATLTNKPKKHASVTNFDPCSVAYLTAYLNRPKVQEAIHANTTKLPYAWIKCSDEINYSYDDVMASVVPIVNEIRESSVRFWVYSGDVDAVLSLKSTMEVLKNMNLTIEKTWSPWFSEGQVGGYTEEYKGNLKFVTVRGAGHSVPSDQPARAFTLFTSFLRNNPLPSVMGKHQVWFLTACVFLFLSLTSHAISLRGVGSSSVSGQTSKDKDFIKRQSGQPEVSFKQYGGYVAVDTNRFLYYYFAEVANANNSAPLVLWMNGGPGCSSLHGAYLENGPFRVHSDGKTLYNNPYSWNKVANVLYIEAPAQVGFSYTTNATGWYKQLFEDGDKLTAEDNYNFLVNWLERFPEYKGREFYITGQSYAGHYGPQLSQLILNRNNKTFVNLKGVMLGNPGFNRTVEDDTNRKYMIDHALVSQENSDRLSRGCDVKHPNHKPSDCMDAFKSFNGLTNRMDLYNIYAPVCLNATLTNKPKKHASVTNFDPCSVAYLTAYLNRPKVQEAIHANTTKLPYAWRECNEDMSYANHDVMASVVPIVNEIRESSVRFWVYSGDVDAVLSVKSTMQVLKNMNLTIVKTWSPWFSEGQVGGYTEEYKGNLKFVTVRGAGHSVPSDQPARAFTLFTSFLRNNPLPSV